MARSVRSKLESRSSRLRLPLGEQHWAILERGLAAGYRRPTRGGAGTWQGRKLIGGRYRFTTIGLADDYETADNRRVYGWAEAQSAVRGWAHARAVAGPLSIAECVRLYVEDLRLRRGDRAAKAAEGRMRTLLLPVLGERRLDSVTYSEWLDWRNSLVRLDGNDEDVRRSRDTANRVFATARAAANYAFHNELVADDRAWRRVKQFRGVSTARRVILSEAEQRLLVDACGPGLRELVMAGCFTGCRLGELTSANVEDFNASDATLRVSGKVGVRELYLPRGAVELFSRLARGRGPSDPLFTNGHGERWTKSLHARPFAAAVGKAGLDPATTYYALRHTFISTALVRGVPTQAVGDHCGTSATMIERNYAKFVQSDRRRYAAIAAPDLRIDESAP